MVFKRCLDRRPEIHELFKHVWHLRHNKRLTLPGPVGKLMSFAKQLGFSWLEPCRLQASVWDMRVLDLKALPADELAHELRYYARHQMWSHAANRRSDMQGLQLGVEVDTSVRLLRSSSSDVHKGILRSVMAGAVNYGHRLFRAGLVQCDVCPFCNHGVPETPEHMFWQCPAWREERFKHSLAITAFRQDWPACFRCCGVLSDGAIIDANAVDWEEGVPLCSSNPSSFAEAACETLEDGKIIVYTDGACVHNQFPTLRRAGVGVWWGKGHGKNYSAPLPGHVQTNQRAELAAVIHALRYEERPVHIKSDSAYVVNGCSKFRHAWAALCWHRVKNADLWKELHILIESRPAGSCAITKVKGHASNRDVKKGRVQIWDKIGNDAADHLASAGAAAHALPADQVRKVKLRMAVAQDVQKLMVDIVAARSTHANTVRSKNANPVHLGNTAPAGLLSTQVASSLPATISSVSMSSANRFSAPTFNTDSSDSQTSSCNGSGSEIISICSSGSYRDASVRPEIFESDQPSSFVSRAVSPTIITQYHLFSGSDFPT